MNDFPFDLASEEDEYDEIDMVLSIFTGMLVRDGDAQETT